MSDLLLVALIVAAGPVLAVLVALTFEIRRSGNRVVNELRQVLAAQAELHELVNSRVSELVMATRSAARTEGVMVGRVEGTAAERQRVADERAE